MASQIISASWCIRVSGLDPRPPPLTPRHCLRTGQRDRPANPATTTQADRGQRSVYGTGSALPAQSAMLQLGNPPAVLKVPATQVPTAG